jgi:hypothetical protein
VDIMLADVRRAHAAQDPDLAQLVVALAAQRDPRPATPVRDGAPTLDGFKRALRTREFSARDRPSRQAFRVQSWSTLEADDAEAPLPDRLKLHSVLMALHAANDPYSREQLLRIIAEVPLRWGPWRALKQIFKQAEADFDLELFGALAARFDADFARRSRGEVTRRTLGYLVRRAWRFLRRVAQQLPAVYADAAVCVLRAYPEDTDWSGTWVANHIFYHETGKYSRRQFKLRRPSTLLKYRAFAELWRRTPRPLFTLLEQARSEQARRFATDTLRSDFRATLRQVEPAWVTRLVQVDSRIVHDFAVWLLDNVPRFEQGAFRELGLHPAVLRLVDSPSEAGRKYAAAYLRTHARDLPLEDLLRLANNDHEGVRAAVRDLLQDRDPRKEVGLDGWGRLLGTPHGHTLAAKALAAHFGARELSPAWFRDRLLSPKRAVITFAAELLPKIHPDAKLGAAFYRDLLDAPTLSGVTAGLALDALERFKAAPDLDWVKRALLNPASRPRLIQWLRDERVPAKELGVDYLKTLAYDGTWRSAGWVAELKASDRPWARELDFDPSLSEVALGLLADVRRFSPDELGFDWLMLLVQRTEPRYFDFATEYMTKAFLPADFAPEAEGAAPEAAAEPGEINVDLGGQSFVFTGKLATMTRSVAQKMVVEAGGSKASAVNGKLNYLVIGDEGSPLYGQGRKGSKQLKAEALAAGGADLKIISETAFLQMLAGETREFDEDTVQAGCERLWALATGPDAPDAPLARFALHYIRHHHPDICLKETDRHVDPGAEIPADFLSFERARGLLAETRAPLLALGLELARYEFARWAPPMSAIVELCELPHDAVRAFVSQALTAEDLPDHRRFRLDPAVLTPDAVYRFCESNDAATRALGMALIGKHPRLAVPSELFRLTESPDRMVRAFVIRQLWSLYRERGITGHWTPNVAPAPALKKKRGPVRDVGPGAPPKPAAPPAGHEDLRGFLRQTLFGIPPARPPKGAGRRQRPLPARKAKLALVEVVRDLALEDAGFAAQVLPALQEFSQSRGQSERAACLVALTRIQRTWPEGA